MGKKYATTSPEDTDGDGDDGNISAGLPGRRGSGGSDRPMPELTASRSAGDLGSRASHFNNLPQLHEARPSLVVGDSMLSIEDINRDLDRLVEQSSTRSVLLSDKVWMVLSDVYARSKATAAADVGGEGEAATTVEMPKADLLTVMRLYVKEDAAIATASCATASLRACCWAALLLRSTRLLPRTCSYYSTATTTTTLPLLTDSLPPISGTWRTNAGKGSGGRRSWWRE